MNRQKAIQYLKNKQKITDKDKYTKEEEAEIEKVMTEGKIYGDPKAEIKW